MSPTLITWLLSITTTLATIDTHRLCDADLLFHQMLVGRDVANPAKASTAAARQVFNFGLQMKNLVYIVGDALTGECVVVDAAYDPEGILAAAKSVGCTNVSGFVATHYHYDHIGSVHGSSVQPRSQISELPGMRYFLTELQGVRGYIHALETSLAAQQIGVEEAQLTALSDGDVLSPSRAGGGRSRTPSEVGARRRCRAGPSLRPWVRVACEADLP